jgi:integrase
MDMAKAGIPILDDMGRVIDFHSFRKTFNTRAAVSGVPLRAAQSLLGHSTPALTAGPYTDERALGLAGETAKLPWVGAPFPPSKRPRPEVGDSMGRLFLESRKIP